MNYPDNPDRVKIEALRRKAVEAWEQAATHKDGTLRDAWTNIAQAYHDLAEQLDRTWQPQQSP